MQATLESAMGDNDLLNHILDIKEAQAASKAKLESLETHVSARLDLADARMNGHAEQIRTLEKASWTRGGAIAVLAAGFTLVASHIPFLKG